jgi:radical SAM protein with 4Fe4S-binding SPASM domain
MSIVRAIVGRIKQKGWRATATEGLRYLLKHGLGSLPALGQVNVEVTTHCNLRCPGCLRTIKIGDGRFRSRYMPVDEFTRIIDSLPSCHRLVPQNLGEPSTHPELIELVKIASASRKFNLITMNSNGLARPAEYYVELMEAGLSELSISVDSFDPEVAERTRTGTCVDRLQQCIRLLVRKFPGRVFIRTVARAENIDDLPSVFGRLNEIGPLNIVVQPYINDGYGPSSVTDSELAALERRLPAMVGRFNNLSATIPDITRKAAICPSPWYSPSISVDGFLTPCCIVEPHVFNFGNVLQSTFSELWHSAETARFRQEFKKRTPICCSKCPYYLVRG